MLHFRFESADENKAGVSPVPATPFTGVIEPAVRDQADGIFWKAEYIDLDAVTRLYIRYGSISDSGVELEKVSDGKVLWRVHAESLGVKHSKYRHEVQVRIEGGVIHVDSRASGGNFHECRKLDTGELVDRTVEKKW